MRKHIHLYTQTDEHRYTFTVQPKTFSLSRTHTHTPRTQTLPRRTPSSECLCLQHYNLHGGLDSRAPTHCEGTSCGTDAHRIKYTSVKTKPHHSTLHSRAEPDRTLHLLWARSGSDSHFCFYGPDIQLIYWLSQELWNFYGTLVVLLKHPKR